MNPEETSATFDKKEEKLLNKSFYRFFFSFVAVIAGVLFFILILGIGSGV